MNKVLADESPVVAHAEWRPIRWPLPNPNFERWASIAWSMCPGVFVFSHHFWARVAAIFYLVAYSAFVFFRERRFRQLVAALSDENELDDDAYFGIAATTIFRKEHGFWLDSGVDLGTLHLVDGHLVFTGIRTDFAIPLGSDVVRMIDSLEFEYAADWRAKLRIVARNRRRQATDSDRALPFRRADLPVKSSGQAESVENVILPPISRPKNDLYAGRRLSQIMYRFLDLPPLFAVVYLGASFAILGHVSIAVALSLIHI